MSILRNVRVTPPEHALGFIRRFVDRQRTIPMTRQLHVLLRIGTQCDEFPRFDIPRRQRITIAIARDAQFLLGDDVHVPRVPDLYIRWISVALHRLGLAIPNPPNPQTRSVHRPTIAACARPPRAFRPARQ
jgi:hypothetical protein